MRFIIGGDLVPTKSNLQYFMNGDAVQLIGEQLLARLSLADYRMFNLEVPLTDEEHPILKCGPNFSSPVAAISGIVNMRADILNLANNHILDQDELGVINTLKALSDHKIKCFGAGRNLAEADCPIFLEKDGIKIGVYGCAEHEFSISDCFSAGANPYDPLVTFDRMKEIKNHCDYLILLYHGGIEEYRYPSPQLQKACRKMIDCGVDLLLCQHSHCIGCEEKYHDGTIVYGQGNFLFDRKKNDYWNTGLLIDVEFSKDEMKIEYIPLVRDESFTRIAAQKEADHILLNFYERSKKINSPEFVKQKFDELSQEKINSYLSACFGKNSIYKKVMKRVFGANIIRRSFRKKEYLKLMNYIECEAHHETFVRGIKNIINISR